MAVFVEGLKNILLHLLGDFNRMICKFLELKMQNSCTAQESPRKNMICSL